MGEGIAELFDAYQVSWGRVLTDPGLKFEGEEVADQDSKDECLDEERIGSVVEGVMELVGLLERAKLDLDAPPSGVELGDLDGVDLFGTCVGDDEAPSILKKAALGYLGLVAFGISPPLSTVLLGLPGGEARGYESASVGAMAADPDGHVESLGGSLSEDLVEVDTFTIEAGEAGG